MAKRKFRIGRKLFGLGRRLISKSKVGKAVDIVGNIAATALSGGGGDSMIPQFGITRQGITFGRRRRRRSGITTNEFGKLLMLSQIVGKHSPAMTIAVMKAMGGRI